MAVPIAELFVSVGADVSAAVAGLTALGTQLETTKGLFEAAAPAADLMVASGIGIAVGLAAATEAAASFDEKLTAVRNNTTLTDEGMAGMREAILRLGAEAPVSLDNLAEGFMHVSNFGFDAADSTIVLEAAMKSAVSTGGNTSATAEVLAAILHEFGLSASEAAATMDKLHIASAEGNLTLEQFSQSFGQVAAFAAAVGVPLDQAAAAMAAMTRHGFDAATAATQVKDEIVHLINPSAAAEKQLKALSNATGIDLVSAFSATGLHALGLTGVMDLTTQAMNKAGLSADEQTALWLKLVPNIRGGAAAFVLAGRGAEDFRSILTDMQNSIGVTDEAFGRMQNQAKFQWDLLSNQFKILGITVGEILLPPLQAGVAIVQDFVARFQGLSQPAQEAAVHFAAIGSVVLTLGGAFVLLAPFIGALPAAFGALAGALAAVAPFILGLAAVALVVRTAWENNLGNLQGIVAEVSARVVPLILNMGLVFQQVMAGQFGEAMANFRAAIGFAVPELNGLFNAIGEAIAGLEPILGNLGLIGQLAIGGDLGGAFDTLRLGVGTVSPPLGALLGLFQDLGGFIATQVVPGMADLADRIMPALGQVSGELGQLWDTLLSPALQKVGGFVAAVVPFFAQLGSDALPLVRTASEDLATFWDTKMLPAFSRVGDFIDANLLKSLDALGTGLSNLTADKVEGVAAAFGGNLLASLSNFGAQLQPLVPVFQSVGSFFASVGNVFAAFAELRSRQAAGAAADDPLTSSLQRLVDFVTANADLGDHMLLLFGPMGQALDAVVTQGSSTAAFFSNLADSLNKFADAIRSLPELPDWVQKALGANSIQGAVIAAGTQVGSNAAGGINTAPGGAGGDVHFNAPITINTPVELKDFLDAVASAVAGAAGRATAPPDNSAFPALAPAQ